MSRSAIYLATPCYGGMAHAHYLRSLLDLRPECARRDVGLHVEFGGGEALIGRARAGMMMAFLRSPATHLLFVDADIGFAPADPFRLLEAGKGVIGGAYPSRRFMNGRPTPEFAVRLGSRRDGDLQQAEYVGTGFLLISRAAAERAVDAYPDLRARLGDVAGSVAREATMVFDSMIDPETGRYLTDYQAFCRRWRDLGREVWVHQGCGLRHVAEVQVSTSGQRT